jgi:hypothetical protein
MNIKVDWIKWYVPQYKSMLLTSTTYFEKDGGVLSDIPVQFNGVGYYEITRTLTKDEYGRTVYPKS